MRITTAPSYITLLLVAACTTARAQEGTGFWVGFMQNHYAADSLVVTISSQTSASGTVSMPLLGWSHAFNVTPTTAATVKLPAFAEALLSDSMSNLGVYVQAQAPVEVNAFSFGAASNDGTALIAEERLGAHYRVQAYSGVPGDPQGRSEFLVVATQDGTTVTITPATYTLGGHLGGVPFSVNLNAGQCYLVQAMVPDSDLTGTIVQGQVTGTSCARLAVFGGSTCADVTSQCYSCDHLFEQCVPTKDWGLSYHAFPFHPSNTYTLRVIAAFANTSVQLSNGASIVLGAGGIADFNNMHGTVCVDADKPINAVELMESNSCAGFHDEPSLMSLRSAEETSLSLSFSAPGWPFAGQKMLTLITTPDNIGALLLDSTPVAPDLFAPFDGCGGTVIAVVPVFGSPHQISAPHGFQAYLHCTSPTSDSYALALPCAAATFAASQPATCYNGGPITFTAPPGFTQPFWTAQSAPSDTLAFGGSLTTTPVHDEVYIVADLAADDGCGHAPYGFPVEFVQPLSVAVAQDTSNACAWMPVQLAATVTPPSDDYTYTWTHPELLDAYTSAMPIAHLTEDTPIDVQVTSAYGCNTTDGNLLVHVQPSDLTYVEAFESPSVVCVGSAVQLEARARQVLISDALNDSLTGLWASVQGGGISDLCGSVSGDALRFNGPNTRTATTVPLDLSTGAVISFFIEFGTGAQPCEEVGNEMDVRLDFSLNGINWVPGIFLYHYLYPAFTQVNWSVPYPAMTTHTRLRWRQIGAFVNDSDNWAIDNVVISTYDTTGLTFSWAPAGIIADPTAAMTSSYPDTTTTYTVTVTDQNSGCQWSADAPTVWPQSAFSVTASNDTAFCGPSPVFAIGSEASEGGAMYAWTNTAGGIDTPDHPTTLVQTNSTGDFIITATNQIGCVVTDTVVVTIHGLPVATITDDGTQLNAPPGYSYQWYLDGNLIGGATGQSFTPAITGTYTVQLTDTFGCIGLSDTLGVSVGVASIVRVPPSVVYDASSGSVVVSARVAIEQVEIWSPSGQLLRQELGIRNDRVTIPIDPAFGIYQVRVIGSGGVFVTKLLIAPPGR